MFFFEISARPLLALTVLLLAAGASRVPLQAQGNKKAAVFREHKAPTLNLIRRSDESYELWEDFMLMQKANSGDANAQHELGIRYLLGRGFGPDTVKSAYWLQKAADQNNVIAHYNLGVFLNNGWGVPWNPFKAFEHFHYAARQGMPEAEYVYGSLLTDNLVVSQNWNEAYTWIRKAADAGYAPARDALTEFEKRGIAVRPDSSVETPRPASKKDSSAVLTVPPWKPVLLDFGDVTSSEEDELAFLKEMLRNGSAELKNALGLTKVTPDKIINDSTLLKLIQNAADAGSPEALAVLGRFYERGIMLSKDPLLAATQYLRAIRLEFPRAPSLLWNIVQDKKFLPEVHRLALQGNPNAEFVCAGLVSVGFDPQLSPHDAFLLLQKASAQNHTQAMIETGICYYAGRWVDLDKFKAFDYWSRAAALGSREARIRLVAMRVIGGLIEGNGEASVRELDSAAHKGSLLAQVALAYCYEKGITVNKNTGEAVRLYRDCAYRGSQTAHVTLRKMYDALRPSTPEFQLREN